MHGVILAAGLGSRLEADGVSEPKPLLPMGGRTLIARQIAVLDSLAMQSITCVVRRGLRFDPPDTRTPVELLYREPPSALDSLAEAESVAQAGPLFCILLDCVIPARDLCWAYGRLARQLVEGADAVLVVGEHVAGTPLGAVRTDATGRVLEVSNVGNRGLFALAGACGFSAQARSDIGLAANGGVPELRAFLKRLAEFRRVATVEVGKVVSIRRVSDIQAAEVMVSGDDV